MFPNNNKVTCPLINKPCTQTGCTWYTQVRGMNPNTGEPVDEWQCAVNLIPLLLIENSKQQRSTAAAVESFRNETVTRSDDLNSVLFTLAQQSLNQLPVSPVNVGLIEPDSSSNSIEQ